MKQKEKGKEKYFDLTRGELNGLLVLVSLIVIIYALPSVVQHLSEDKQQFFEGDLQIADSSHLGESERNMPGIEGKKTTEKISMFSFDPNTLSSEGWQKLGLSARQAQAIINYRQRGGIFYKPEDLRKMYTIRPDLCERMLPFVSISKPGNPQIAKVFNKDQAYKKTTLPLVDINLADSVALDALKGIGGSFARRIIAYRDRLGGFHDLSQLLEVYGLDSAKFRELLPQVTLTSGLKKININTATFDELKLHPYLRYREINAILQYRKQHGNFSGADDLKKILLIEGTTIQKIMPYLTF